MKTYVFTDVDGVINVETGGHPNWLDTWPWATHSETKLFIGNGTDTDTMNLRWSPSLVAGLNELSAREDVDFHFLTTWCGLGPEELPRIMGLECQRWSPIGGNHYAEYHSRDEEWWKLTALRAWYDSQTEPVRFVWIDDELRQHGCLLWTASLPKGTCLPINPTASAGISPEELSQIEEFIA